MKEEKKEWEMGDALYMEKEGTKRGHSAKVKVGMKCVRSFSFHLLSYIIISM